MPAFDRDTAKLDRAVADSVCVPAAADSASTGDELDSQRLFAGSRRRVIVHQGERYCLQVTRAGKLLLTK
ncbi:hemin uptake protein HemP [Nevskia sp.]|uniref:hemin uptake protein HemP n=1 Tax=Nevskia sp. TaxID=1929292 RepID=UPI0025D9C351|nr:hemin uptake protein HemP [Nevskia sp.]